VVVLGLSVLILQVHRVVMVVPVWHHLSLVLRSLAQVVVVVVEPLVRVEQAVLAVAETARLMEMWPATEPLTLEAVGVGEKLLLALAVTVVQGLSSLEFQQAQVLASPVG
jgi:hypothetical protein